MITDEIRNTILEKKRQGKISYAWLSKKSGVCASTIYNYMYGQRGISTELSEMILNAMGLTLKIVPMEDGGRNG